VVARRDSAVLKAEAPGAGEETSSPRAGEDGHAPTRSRNMPLGGAEAARSVIGRTLAFFWQRMEQPQQNLFERVASASVKVADLKANLETAEQQIAELHAEIEADGGPLVVHTSSQHLRHTMRWKRRGSAILLAGMFIALVALLHLSAETQREVARLRLAGGASDLLITKLRHELVILRETILTETFSWTRKQLDAALGSPNDADKIAVSAQAETMQLRDENLHLRNNFLKTKELLGETQRQTEDEVTRLRKDLPAQAQEAVATQQRTGPGATAPSDQKVHSRTPEIERVSIEEILISAEVLSGPVVSKSAALDKVSPGDLLFAPDHHVDHQVMVTGSVIWLLRRYWLQSDSGQLRMLIDVERLQSDERNKLREVVAQIESLVQARAHIMGTIERHGTDGYRLAATKLVFVE